MTEKAKGTQCAAMVRSGAWHTYGCDSPARWHVAGKDWCGTHNPEKADARRAAADEAEALGVAMSNAYRDMMQVQRQIARRLRTNGYIAGSFLQGYVDDLKAADAKYVAARAAADANGKVRKIHYPGNGWGDIGTEGLS